ERELVDGVAHAAAPMRIAKHRVRAPTAAVRAPSGRDQVHAPRAVVPAPYVDVPPDIDRVAIGPGEGVDVAYLRAVWIRDDGAALVNERRARDPVEPVRPARTEGGEQLQHGLLAFAEHHDVGSARQILGRVV